MYDADIRSMDEAAKGARSWMPPELGTGLFMTPYNPKILAERSHGAKGMGQYMLRFNKCFLIKKNRMQMHHIWKQCHQ